LAHSPALRVLYAQPEIELDRAIALLDETGAREFTQNAAQRYSDNAVAHLNAAEPAGADGDALRALTAELIRRKY
jgi:geranylgeranyl pyrophosphate synthase